MSKEDYTDDQNPMYERRLRRAADRYLRFRTVMISVIVSGIVTLFIQGALERQTFNEQADRSRLNCQFVNDDRRTIGDSLDEQADNILGDHSKLDGDPDENIDPINLKGTSFEEFEPLMRIQARDNRAKSRLYYNRLEDCNKVFPKRGPIPFVGS